MNYKKKLLILLLLLSPKINCYVAGTIDPSFNSNGAQPGTIETTINNINLQASAAKIVFNPNLNKIILGSSIDTAVDDSGHATASQYALAQLNADGTLDTNFNIGGIQPGTVSTDIDHNILNDGYDIALQTDNKILVCGDTFNNLSGVISPTQFGLAQFNPDGSLDTSFNSSGPQPGTVSTYIDGTSIGCSAYAIAIQPTDHKIVLAGDQEQETSGVTQKRFAIARFNPNGSLDTSFNPTGAQPGTQVINTINGYSTDNDLTCMALDDLGHIYIAGTIINTDTNFKEFGLVRLTNTGLLDTTFNPTGITPGTTSIIINNEPTHDYECLGIAIQADQKIVLAGIQRPNISGITNNYFALARLNQTGSLDTSFNPTGAQPGTLINTFNNSILNYATNVLITPDQKILVCGISAQISPTIVYASLAKFNQDGTLDSTFNPNGIQPGTTVTTIANNNTNYAAGLAFFNNQYILISGGSNNVFNLDAQTNFGAARFYSTTGADSNDAFTARLIEKYSHLI